MGLFKKPLNKKFNMEPKGLYLLNYLFNKCFLGEEDYIEAYDNVTVNYMNEHNIDPEDKEQKALIEMQFAIILLNILPAEEQEKWLSKIDDEEEKKLIRKTMKQVKKM